jgi:hypothetical protein
MERLQIPALGIEDGIVLTVRVKTSPTRLFFALNRVATSIPHFVSFEVRTVDTLCRLSFFARFWQWALIAVFRMETVIYVALELISAMKPRAGTNEDIPGKPFWTVVARGGAAIRSDVIVTIGTIRGYSDADADLSLRFGSGNGGADSSNSS